VWLILAGSGRADEARHPDAVPIFQCTFGDDWDVNYDGWPDRWVRKTGPGLPHYVNVAIKDDETAVGKKCLQIDLDGAAAEVESPPIRVMPRFSYVFECQLNNTGLKHSAVVVTLNFCDSTGRVLQTEKAEPVAVTKGWHQLTLGPVEPRDPAITRVVIGLQVQRGAKGDLQGHVALADVWLARSPRIDVSTNSTCNVYTELTGVEVQCALSGIREQNTEIDFQLLDGTNKEIERKHVQVTGKLIVDDASRNAEVTDGGKGPAGYECTAKWRPKIPDYGFYSVVVLMKGPQSPAKNADPERQLDSRTVDLVVVPPLPVQMPRRGEFGWTLPDADRPLPFQDLSWLLPKVGINWVKLPLWYDAASPRRGDELIRFVELLGASNIDVVGIIDKPPTQMNATGRPHKPTSIAEVLSQDSPTWAAALEPVMTRLSLRVRWWQIGSDYDTSFASLKELNKRIADLRTVLFRFGQDVRLGMSWDWSTANAHAGSVRWDFEQLCTEKQPADAKFEQLLAMPRRNSARRWVMVEPPAKAPAGQDPAIAYERRAMEFVRRLIAAKVSGADAIIVAKPFNDENGLMRANGMPADLLLPWRTTAAMLGGSQYIGQMQLPNGSENRIFLRGDGQVVMVVWNHEPTQEVLYLGEHIQQIDLLGRSKPAPGLKKEQAIDVGPTPSFVLGLHEAVARWRMDAEFERRQVPSIFGKSHHNSLHFKNYFPQGVGGTVKIVIMQDPQAETPAGQESNVQPSFAADRWSIDPPQTTFQLAANAEMKFAFDVQLKSVWYGRKPVRVDFTIEADEKIEFSIYRYLEIGTQDLTLDVKSHLDKEGTLIVEQTMTNSAARTTDFKCSLQAVGHRPQRRQVYRLGKNPDRKIYQIPNGRDLVGKELWLRLEEVNGLRTLKYRFIAEGELPPPKSATPRPDAGNADPLKAEGKTRLDRQAQWPPTLKAKS
jgi:hypothetical protein